jgi:hypothetical protein
VIRHRLWLPTFRANSWPRAGNDDELPRSDDPRTHWLLPPRAQTRGEDPELTPMLRHRSDQGWRSDTLSPTQNLMAAKFWLAARVWSSQDVMAGRSLYTRGRSQHTTHFFQNPWRDRRDACGLHYVAADLTTRAHKAAMASTCTEASTRAPQPSERSECEGKIVADRWTQHVSTSGARESGVGLRGGRRLWAEFKRIGPDTVFLLFFFFCFLFFLF